jgi:hypothetical protein
VSRQQGTGNSEGGCDILVGDRESDALCGSAVALHDGGPVNEPETGPPTEFWTYFCVLDTV